MIFKDINELREWRDSLPLKFKVVATNGCFDILHVGHVRYLNYAAKLGTHLIVGLNSDNSVKQLKGENRPINKEQYRAEVLDGLKAVSGVFIFDGVICADFLSAVLPHIYVKAGDYTMDTLHPWERLTLLKHQAKIKFLPFVKGVSTTKIIEDIKA